MIRKIIQIILVIFTMTCGNDTKQPEAKYPLVPAASISPKIVLITIDGVRWLDVFDQHDGVGNFKPTSRELMPNIYKHFVDNGIAIGKNSPAFTQNPWHISQPGYLEIVSGHASLTCINNYCPQNTNPTIINQFNRSTVINGWDTIAKVIDTTSTAANIGRHIRSPKWLQLGLDETDYITMDQFDEPEYRDDADTQIVVMSYLKYYQADFVWIGYGNTDEFAHMNNKLQYWIALSTVDEYIKNIIDSTEPNTVFIICPDHGRSINFRDHGGDPASGRVWIMIGGAGISKAGFVSYDRNVYLADIYPTILEITKGIKSDKSLFKYQK